MKQLAPPPRVDRQVYLGLEVYTADNQRLGTVIEVISSGLSGEPVIRVRNERVYGSPVTIPIRMIGVVSRRRLMLDIASDRIASRELEQFSTSMIHRR